MRRTLDSVVAQTRPARAVGGRRRRLDRRDAGDPGELRAAAAVPARRPPRRPRAARSVGPGVIEAFYAGLADGRSSSDFDYVCKLDLDLELPPRYFEILIERMEREPAARNVLGEALLPRIRAPAQLVPEVCGDEMSVGMTKFYRTTCFREIGGFVRQVMWDGIDCHRCRMLGWIAESVDDEPTALPAPAADGIEPEGHLDGARALGLRAVLHGHGASVPRWRARCSACPSTPCFYGSVAMLWGYVSSAARGACRATTISAFRRFLRRYQRACLLHGKREATRRVNEAQAAVWPAQKAARGE